jgi:hypothetical protein
MDFAKLQVLWCIIYRSKQAFDALTQRSTFHKGLIEYNKVNGITPMNTHVQTTHSKLFIQRKKIKKKVVKPTTHTWQLRKKRIDPFNYVIITFLLPWTLWKNLNTNVICLFVLFKDKCYMSIRIIYTWKSCTQIQCLNNAWHSCVNNTNPWNNIFCTDLEWAHEASKFMMYGNNKFVVL